MNQKEKTQSRVFEPLRHFTENSFLNRLVLPAVGSWSGAGLAGTNATCWLSPSARTAVQAIEDTYFLCLVNEKSF